MNPDLRTVVNALLLEKLSQTVDQFIATRRTEGKSWERIAKELFEVTDGAVDVSTPTVLRWGSNGEAA